MHVLYSVKFRLSKKTAEACIDIDTKDYRALQLAVKDEDAGQDLFKKIYSVAFPNVLSKDVFALKYS